MAVYVYKVSNDYYGPKNLKTFTFWFYVLIAILCIRYFVVQLKQYLKQKEYEKEWIYNNGCILKPSMFKNSVSLLELFFLLLFIIAFIYFIFLQLNPNSEYIFNRRYFLKRK